MTSKQVCKVDVINSLVVSGLKAIQNERKSRMREVCEMCRRNRSAMECNHLTMDEDAHKRIMYKHFYVNDKHKVSNYTFLAIL